MERVVPVLAIDNYDEAVAFYVSGLRFRILFEHRHEPGFPVYMVVQQGDLVIGLSEHSRGHQGSEIYLFVDDLEMWHGRCLASGIKPEQSPTKMPWGNTEMLLKDPFGNALRFTQEQTHAGSPSTPNR